jgi:hypothetical protein
LIRLFEVEPGIHTENILTMRIEFPRSRFPGNQEQQAFFQEAQRRIEGLPGVVQASAVSNLPLDGSNWGRWYTVEGEPEPAPGSEEAAAPSVEEPGQLGKRWLLWLGAAVLVVASIAAGVWRWRARSRPRFPEPRLGSSQRTKEEKDPDDSIPAFSGAIAAFSKVVGGNKTGTTEEFSFTASKDIRGIVVSYKCHSQSNSNYAQNTVEITIRRGEEVIGKLLDSYDSQTNWGDVMKAGFWHSREFGDVTLKRGDRVDLTVTAKAGDFRNYVTEIKICPLKARVSYPNDREFHGPLERDGSRPAATGDDGH